MNELEKVIKEKRTYKNKPKKLVKYGTIAVDVVETTPVVWQDRLLRFVWNRDINKRKDGIDISSSGCYQLIDMQTDEIVAEFGKNHSFGSAFSENGKMYAIGTYGGFGSDTLVEFVSEDLVNWESHTIFSNPEWTIYNTSFCKGKDGYILAIEIDRPAEIAGVPYTIVFLRSDDLMNWEFLDTKKHVYRTDRYSACPAIRYVDGYYYMIYLESFPAYNYSPYIVRSKDLSQWEVAPMNPIMFYSDEDRNVLHPEKFTPEQLEEIATSLNTNNSDVDLCEWNGKTVILYSWGNQLGSEFLAYAEYDGPIKEFLESFFNT